MLSIQKLGAFEQSSNFFGIGDKRAVEAAKLREKMNQLNLQTSEIREKTASVHGDQAMMHHTAERIKKNLKEMGKAQQPSIGNVVGEENDENGALHPQVLASAKKVESVQQLQVPVVQNNGLELQDIQITDKQARILDLVKKLEETKSGQNVPGKTVDQKNEKTILGVKVTTLTSAAMKIFEFSLMVISFIGQLIASIHGELKKWIFSSEASSKMGMLLNPAWVFVVSVATFTAIQRGVVALMR